MYLSLYKQIIDKDGNIFTGLLKKESDIFRNYLFFLLVLILIVLPGFCV